MTILSSILTILIIITIFIPTIFMILSIASYFLHKEKYFDIMLSGLVSAVILVLLMGMKLIVELLIYLS